MNDALFGVLIKDVHSCNFKSNLDGVAGTSGRTGGNTSGESLLIGNEVQIDFSTHKFGNFDVGLDDGFGHSVEDTFFIADAFGTETDDNFFTDVGLEIGVVDLFSRQLEGVLTEGNVNVFTLLFELRVDEVHLRRADEACDEDIAGRIVEVLRSINLLDDTALHIDDTGSYGHSFDLVVRDLDEGGTESLVDLGQLGSHLSTELSVKVGERFVQKEYLRITNDCTAECNTLLLTTGESLRITVEKVSDFEDTSSFFNFALDGFFGHLAEFKTERHVIENSHVRIQSVVLEYHRDISVLGGNVIDESVADEKFALGNFFKSGNHTKSSGFTATGRTYEDDKLGIFDFKAEVRNRSYTAGVLFVDVSQGKACHNFDSVLGDKSIFCDSITQPPMSDVRQTGIGKNTIFVKIQLKNNYI